MRVRLSRPLTLSEKLLFGHLCDPQQQHLDPGRAELSLLPDRVVLQDVLGQTAWLQFAQTGRRSVAVPTTVHCDHLVIARHGADDDLASSRRQDDEVYHFLRSAAARYGAGFWEPGAGIIHQIVLENYAVPGHLVLGTDSHTPNAGGIGACAIGVGGADAVETMAGQPWTLLHPRRIAVVLTGELGGWTAPKDVILAVVGQLGTSGGTQCVIEYIGPGARTLSATGRATITNMGAETGATTSIFPADDEAPLRYLAATGRAALLPVISAHRALFAPDPEVELDPERFYDRVIRIDLSSLEPHVVGPHSPARARPLSALARERGAPEDALSAALIGSCTNSSYEDMSRAADVAAQAAAVGRHAAVPLFVTPGSLRVRETLERDGQLGTLTAAGATVLASACGPCIGQWERGALREGAPSSIVTSYNRNFPGRNDGNPATAAFIASPEIVMAMALAGRLSFDPRTDELLDGMGRPFRLSPPSPADLPPAGFTAATAHYIAPPADGSAITLPFVEGSERLAALPRWRPWDEANRRKLVDMPVLIKTRGATTTDQISPAGRWLRYRGHLERFSENLLSGAIDAHTGERGITVDQLTDTRGSVSSIAKNYRDHGLCSVIVGDTNYGEGSSREHAALSPRLLGVAAVIAKSFARIHQQNLRKQGLLALQFITPSDYDLIGPHDRISLLDLDTLVKDVPITCRIRHKDGNESLITLSHGCNEFQLGWFYAGGFLNVPQSEGA